jgi:hypothetical protein
VIKRKIVKVIRKMKGLGKPCACLACVRPWVPSPVLKKRIKADKDFSDRQSLMELITNSLTLQTILQAGGN